MEVGITPSDIGLGAFDLTCFQERYGNEEIFRDLNDRIHRLVPLVDELHATYGDELRPFLVNLRK